MFSFFKKDDFVGVLPDTRSVSEQSKDWQATELLDAGIMTPVFRTVGKNEWNKYTLRDQDGSGSCVSQAIAKGFEVLYKKQTGKTVVFSATPIYQKRQGKPNGGMYIHDAFAIAIKSGTCPESYMPSQKMSDKQMDAATLPANYEEINDMLDAIAYVAMPADFDYVAAWIEQNGYASIHIAADRKNWSKDFPSLGSKSRGILHATAGVDAVTYEGVQYIVIEDSWGEFGEFKGQRLLSREVFNDMFTRGAGFTVLEYDVTDRLKFQPFTVKMEQGQTSDEVAKLQTYLREKGYFPQGTRSTGYYGNITALAVYNFQMANKVASPAILNKYKGKYCHEATLKAINKSL